MPHWFKITAVLLDWANIFFLREKFLSWRTSLMCIVVELYMVGSATNELPQLVILLIPHYLDLLIEFNNTPKDNISNAAKLFNNQGQTN